MRFNYTPDNWVVLKIVHPEEPKPIYKVLGGWSGGYLNGDSWRINSGVSHVTEDEEYYYFHGYSGSTYQCYKKGYALRMSNAGVYNQLKEKFGDAVELLDEGTDWTAIEYPE